MKIRKRGLKNQTAVQLVSKTSMTHKKNPTAKKLARLYEERHKEQSIRLL
jgi:hypothetical protein